MNDMCGPESKSEEWDRSQWTKDVESDERADEISMRTK